MNELLNDWTGIRTFATEKNLMRHLRPLMGQIGNGIMVVRTPGGRWTVLILKSFLDMNEIPIRAAIDLGYKVVG